ncbi:uncharacterized protein B0T15DRAFT_545990 [Chaetomium strumarium]|uniref:Uncharacterized protein n=1 Tax=Chaetomium strumarium TaxID=1170767 RepID=A0AAJ0M5S8_9PEZI|nr:hypothetical protein B0T15DRAFT_545990 [Chaetomium strumarium]
MSSGPRRNTDTDRRGLQYHTSQGGYPVSVADAQSSSRDPRRGGRSGYPGEYRNSEGRGADQHQNFDPRITQRNPAAQGYYETPVHPPSSPTRFDPDRRAATLRQVDRAQPENLHPNDRRRVAAQGGPNDAGSRRAVSSANRDGTGTASPVGMMRHPEGNARGYDRLPYEPLDRSGRAERDRYNDYRGGNTGTSGGSQSWPPRSERSEDLTRYEERYERRGGGGGGSGSGRRR